MSKKLQGNGLFASSRMMLPEHKATFNEHLAGHGENARPVLDAQEAEHISRCLAASLTTEAEITLVRYGRPANEKVRGVVTKVDPFRREVTLRGNEGCVKVPFADMIDVLDNP